MSEQIRLTTPVSKPSRLEYKIKRINLEPLDALVYIELLGDDGVVLAHSYTGIEATNLMIALNKANLTANSLQKRVFAKLIADGILTGSVTGTPE